MTILIADDHAIVRMGLNLYLSEILPQAKIILCETFPKALEALTKHTVDLVVLDIVMTGSENTQMVPLIRKQKPNVPILIYSGLDEEFYALPYIKAGADGYLSKNEPHTEFARAVEVLLDQGKYVSKKIQQLMLSKLADNPNKIFENPLESLSKGESAVLKLMMDGKWTKDIAATLKLKPTTISTYKKKIFEKFEVSNITDLLQKLSFFKHI